CQTRKRRTCVLPDASMIAWWSIPEKRCCRIATRPCFTASSFEMATPFPSRPSRRKKKSSAYGPSSVVRISMRTSSSQSTRSSLFFPSRGPKRLVTPSSPTSISSTGPFEPGRSSARKHTTQNAPAHHGMPPCRAKAKLSAANTAQPMSAMRLRERIAVVTGCAPASAARIVERAELQPLGAARAHHVDQLDERVERRRAEIHRERPSALGPFGLRHVMHDLRQAVLVLRLPFGDVHPLVHPGEEPGLVREVAVEPEFEPVPHERVQRDVEPLPVFPDQRKRARGGDVHLDRTRLVAAAAEDVQRVVAIRLAELLLGGLDLDLGDRHVVRPPRLGDRAQVDRKVVLALGVDPLHDRARLLAFE